MVIKYIWTELQSGFTNYFSQISKFKFSFLKDFGVCFVKEAISFLGLSYLFNVIQSQTERHTQSYVKQKC